MKEIPGSCNQESNDKLTKVIEKTTKIVVRIIIILLTVILLYSLFEFIILTLKGVFVYNEIFNFSFEPYDKNKLFLTQVQGFISAVLLLTLIIGLLRSMIEYIKAGTTSYIEIITEIALIALVRYLLALDIEHINPGTLIGLSALIFVLGLFYLFFNQKLKLPVQKIEIMDDVLTNKK
jgi:uncharacterized membrane protein (DUF373 family)